jgi:hypothetical protein
MMRGSLAQQGYFASRNGQVAQLVEQRIENPRVGGSIPPLATILFAGARAFCSPCLLQVAERFYNCLQRHKASGPVLFRC